MRKSLLVVTILTVIGCTAAWAIEPVALVNPSFEQPGTTQQKGFTNKVPGWNMATPVVDSGVQTGRSATDGVWSAYLNSVDPNLWQLTDYTIGAGQIFVLSVDARISWLATTLMMGLFYDVNGVHVPIASQDVTLTATSAKYTLMTSAVGIPDAVGRKLGIAFRNVTPSTISTYLGLDNVRLQMIVPNGINIIWVTDVADRDADGVQDDQQWIDQLVFEGYDVDARPGYWNDLGPIDPNDPNGPTKFGLLNATDLVIFSRTGNTANYDDSATEIAQWNAIKTPMLNLDVWMVRSNRWKWINSTGATKDSGAPLIQALNAAHPLFAGVTFEPFDPNDPNAVPNVVNMLDGTVGSGQTSFMTTLDMGKGTLLGKAVGANLCAIAEWKSGVEYYTGAGQIAGDHRLLFNAGTQETTGTPQGAYNLTAEGQKVYFNAINYLLAQPLPAREPQPASGATGVALDGTLTWRPGKLALKHEVYFSSNKNDVVSGKALIDVVTTNSFNLKPLGLILGTTYYWKIVEVNGTQKWTSEVWSLTATDYIAVDDFESYDAAGIVKTWIDGWKAGTGGTLTCNVVPAVSTATVHGGKQSMALPFDNSKNPFLIDVLRVLSSSQDWTSANAGVTTLVLFFRGDPNNPAAPLYAEINGYRIPYTGDAGNIRKASWTQWNISLAGLPIVTRKVTTLNIGVGDPQSPMGRRAGTLYIDDIRLYRVAP